MNKAVDRREKQLENPGLRIDRRGAVLGVRACAIDTEREENCLP